MGKKILYLYIGNVIGNIRMGFKIIFFFIFQLYEKNLFAWNLYINKHRKKWYINHKSKYYINNIPFTNIIYNEN